MKKEVYDEDTISLTPSTADMYSYLQDLKDDLARMEGERDEAITLLREVLDLEDELIDERGNWDDLDAIMNRIREFVDGGPDSVDY